MGNGLPLSGGNYSTGQLLVHPSPDAPSFFSVYEGHAHSNPSEKVSIFKSDPSAMPSTPRMFSFALEHAKKFGALISAGDLSLDGLLRIYDASNDSGRLNLVTEPVVPLRSILSGLSIEERFAGLTTVAKTLETLHTEHQLSHNNVSMNTIYVNTKTNQWKLLLDFALPLLSDSLTILRESMAFQDRYAIPTEFSALTSASGYPLHARDAWGFGGLIRAVLREDAHAEKLARDLMTPEPRSRPTLRDVTLSRAPFSTNKVAKLIGNIFSVRSGKLAPAAEKRVFGVIITSCGELSEEFLHKVVAPLFLKAPVVAKPTSTTSLFNEFLFTMKRGSSVNGLFKSEQLYNNSIVPFVRWAWEHFPSDPSHPTRTSPKLEAQQVRLYGALCRTLHSYYYSLPAEIAQSIGAKIVANLEHTNARVMTASFIGAACYAETIAAQVNNTTRGTLSQLFGKLVHAYPHCSAISEQAGKVALSALFRILYTDAAWPISAEHLEKFGSVVYHGGSAPLRRFALVKMQNFVAKHDTEKSCVSAAAMARLILAPLVTTLVDQDAAVRDKARKVVRKITYVLERKDSEAASVQGYPSPAKKSASETKPERKPATSKQAVSQLRHDKPAALPTRSPSSVDEDPSAKPKTVVLQNAFDDDDWDAWDDKWADDDKPDEQPTVSEPTTPQQTSKPSTNTPPQPSDRLRASAVNYDDEPEESVWGDSGDFEPAPTTQPTKPAVKPNQQVAVLETPTMEPSNPHDTPTTSLMVSPLALPSSAWEDDGEDAWGSDFEAPASVEPAADVPASASPSQQPRADKVESMVTPNDMPSQPTEDNADNRGLVEPEEIKPTNSVLPDEPAQTDTEAISSSALNTIVTDDDRIVEAKPSVEDAEEDAWGFDEPLESVSSQPVAAPDKKDTVVSAEEPPLAASRLAAEAMGEEGWGDDEW